MNKKICCALLGILYSSIETGFCSNDAAKQYPLKTDPMIQLEKDPMMKDVMQIHGECITLINDMFALYRQLVIAMRKLDPQTLYAKSLREDLLHEADYDTVMSKINTGNNTIDYDSLSSNLSNYVIKCNTLENKYNQLHNLVNSIKKEFTNNTQTKDDESIQQKMQFLSAKEKEIYRQMHSNIRKQKLINSLTTVLYAVQINEINKNNVKSLINFINQKYLECDDETICKNQTTEALKRLVNLQQALYPLFVSVKEKRNKLTPEKKLLPSKDKFEKLGIALKRFNDNQLKNLSLLFNQIALMSDPTNNIKTINDLYRCTIFENMTNNKYDISSLLQFLRNKKQKISTTEDFYTDIINSIIAGWIKSNKPIDEYANKLDADNVLQVHLKLVDIGNKDVQAYKNELLSDSYDTLLMQASRSKEFVEAFDIFTDIILFLDKYKYN